MMNDQRSDLVQTPRVNATVRARLNSGTDDGEIIVTLMVRQRDYVGDSFCYYPIGRDMNNGSYPNGKAWEIVSSSGWTDITSATQWVGAWAAQHTFDEDWHAADVRVKIRSRIETSGESYAWVHLDVARSEDRSIP